MRTLKQIIRTEMGTTELIGGANVGELHHVHYDGTTYNLEILEIISTEDFEIENDLDDFSAFLG